MTRSPAVEPQHAVGVERGLLTAILLEPGVLSRVEERLAEADLYQESHRIIYRACLVLQGRGQRPDHIMVTNHLREHALLERVGGANYISDLIDSSPDVANVVHYANIVHDKAAQRRALAALSAAQDLRPDHLGAARRALDELSTSKRVPEVGIILADVEPETVKWLWPGRIPRGTLTVVDGDPGLGKSTLTLDLAARVTTSGRMPDGSEGATGGVVLLTAEDGLADTVRPRLEAAGADLSRVVALGLVGEGKDRRPVGLPDDLELVRAAIARVGAVLVVVDPLMAFLSGAVDSHRDQDIRRCLAQLAQLAAETGVAVLIIRHLNKLGAGNPLYRGGGSIGIVAAARAGFLVARDPADPACCILAATKANLGPMPSAWRYRVDADGPDSPAYVTWVSACAVRAVDLCAPPQRQERASARLEAEEWLREALAGGPRPARELLDEAEAKGYARRTLDRARSAAGVVAEQTADGWTWRLRDGRTPAQDRWRSDPPDTPKNISVACQDARTPVRHGMGEGGALGGALPPDPEPPW